MLEYLVMQHVNWPMMAILVQPCSISFHLHLTNLYSYGCATEWYWKFVYYVSSCHPPVLSPTQNKIWLQLCYAGCEISATHLQFIQ